MSALGILSSSQTDSVDPATRLTIADVDVVGPQQVLPHEGVRALFPKVVGR